MLASPHILTGSVALISGALSFSVKKGSKLHRKFGLIFVISMAVMASSGALLAILNSERLNAVAGLVTFYLVATAYLTVRSAKRQNPSLNYVLTTFGFAVGLYAIVTGIISLNSGVVLIDGNPAQVIIIFCSIAVLAAVLDIRAIKSHRISRKAQLIRHIWRVGIAMFIATASFFLGQSQVIPEALRQIVILVTPVLLVLFVTVFWLFRIAVWGAFKRDSCRVACLVCGIFVVKVV
ncbi:hypothetical protein RJP56_17660 [Shewanella baltica]|uniref:hypothetical protein n=1 Tax=Shewanella baltica TaxID=62322 RepID=UPI002870CCCF|nr:hypothetical protein [Shewanella baltica]MDR9767888.1 hypothetical protein [Shewanella baltica]